MALGRPAIPFLERFEACLPDILDDKECWIWQGRPDRHGYGRIRRPGCGPSMLAHRAAWELHHAEPVPAGMVVMHACDIRACVNPSHLRPGTPLENNLDKVQKGRQISGAKHHKTKLTPDQVRFIRRALDAKLATKKQLARQFGVADTSIHRIAIRKNWRHLN